MQFSLHGQDAGVLEGLLGLVHHHLEQPFGLWVLGIEEQGASKVLIAELGLQEWRVAWWCCHSRDREGQASR